MTNMIKLVAFIMIGCGSFSVYGQLPSQRVHLERDEQEDIIQTDVERESAFSIIGGIIGSQIRGDGFSGFNMPGLQAGFAKSWTLNKDFDFRVELMYLAKGSRERPPEDAANLGTTSLYRARLNVLELPIGFRWYKEVEALGPLSADLAVAPGILLSQMQRTEAGGEENPGYSTFHLSYMFGANYHFSPSFSMGFRWNNSIIPIMPTNAPEGTATLIEQIFGTGRRSMSLGIHAEYRF